MRDAGALEFCGKLLGFIDRDGSDEDRLSLGVAGGDLLDDGVVLSLDVLIDNVGAVNPDHGTVGRHLDDVQRVDFAELGLLGQRGTRHTGELVVHTEIILERNGRQCLVFLLNLDAFLCLDRLVQTVGVPTSGHQTSRKGIDDHDALVIDNIVHIAHHASVRADCLIDMVGDGRIFGVGEVCQPEKRFRPLRAPRRQNGAVRLFIHDVIGVNVVLALLVVQLLDDVFAERADKGVGAVVQLGRFLPGAGNNQRRSRLVNQDGVYLVHDGKGVSALNHALLIHHHIVAEVVEAEFIVGTVGNIRRVSRALFVVGLPVHDQPRRQSEKSVDTTHFFAVAARQVVIDRDDMHALTGQRVQIGGHRCDQCFSLAGLHFGDTPLVKQDTTDHLDAERALAEDARGSLTHGGKGIRQNIIRILALREPFLQAGRCCTKLVLAHALIGRRQRIHCADDRFQPLELMIAVRPEYFLYQRHEVAILSSILVFILFHPSRTRPSVGAV